MAMQQRLALLAQRTAAEQAAAQDATVLPAADGVAAAGSDGVLPECRQCSAFAFVAPKVAHKIMSQSGRTSNLLPSLGEKWSTHVIPQHVRRWMKDAGRWKDSCC